MSFHISVGKLPAGAASFRNLKPGSPALVVKHPEGPWQSQPFKQVAYLDIAPGITDQVTYTVGDTEIRIGLGTAHGSTTQADGIKEIWQRPQLAYAPEDSLDTLLDNGTLFIFPKF